MDVNLRDLRSVRNPKVRIKIMQGHFARSHSHVNTYIDISTIKSRCDHAREAARMLTEPYLSSAEVDTIVCLDGMEVVGAFMAELLAAPGSVSVNRGEEYLYCSTRIKPAGTDDVPGQYQAHGWWTERADSGGLVKYRKDDASGN